MSESETTAFASIDPLRIVDISHLVPPYRPQYTILMNKTRHQVMAFARAHPEVFVFPFVSLPPDECPDYRWLRRRGCAVRAFIAQPIYVGNLKPMDNAIRQIVAVTLHQDISECDEVAA